MPIPLTILVAPHNKFFEWQIKLLEYTARKFQQEESFYISLIQRNRLDEKPAFKCNWQLSLKHKMVLPFYEIDKTLSGFNMIYYPLNIQMGLAQIIDDIADDIIIEIIETDMFHLKRKTDIEIESDTIICDNIYEEWHLKSMTNNKDILSEWVDGDIRYTGGFFPMIMHAGTLKKILPDWIKYHLLILKQKISDNKKWWAGMFAFQAACQLNNIKMLNKNDCYIPPINGIDGKRIAHYSVDLVFNKRMFPNVDFSKFEDNMYYQLIGEWHASSQIR